MAEKEREKEEEKSERESNSKRERESEEEQSKQKEVRIAQPRGVEGEKDAKAISRPKPTRPSPSRLSSRSLGLLSANDSRESVLRFVSQYLPSPPSNFSSEWSDGTCTYLLLEELSFPYLL